MPRLIVLGDGETYEEVGEARIIEVTEEEWDKILLGHKVSRVIPDISDRGMLINNRLCTLIEDAVDEVDNDGQIVLYTGCRYSADGKVVPMFDEEDDEEEEEVT